MAATRSGLRPPVSLYRTAYSQQGCGNVAGAFNERASRQRRQLSRGSAEKLSGPRGPDLQKAHGLVAMANVNGREVVSIRDAGKIADVSRRTIYNWIEKGLVQTVRNPSGHTRIYRDSLFRPASDTHRTEHTE